MVAVIGDQGEKEGVCLAFAGGAVTASVVDDSSLPVDDLLRIAVPEGPSLLGAAALLERSGA